MRYLITTNIHPPFLSKWYEDEMFNPDVEMTVYDLYLNSYTTDGKTWNEIIVDHL